VAAALLGTVVGAAPSSAAAPHPSTAGSSSRWQEDLSAAQRGDVNVSRAGGRIQLRDTRFHPAASADPDGYGMALFPAHTLAAPANQVEVHALDRLPAGSAVDVAVRELRGNGQWSEWTGADRSGTVQLPQRSGTVQVRATLHGAAVLTGLALSASADAAAPAIVRPAAAESYTVYATDEGLVGDTTANGYVIQPDDHFVALPSGTALSPYGSDQYSVQVCGPTACETAPVWDIGPWNTRDNYWAPSAQRTEFSDLSQGEPESQAAYETGYNGGLDQFGRTVLNPAGIDLADGTFADIGLTDNGWVTVTYLWTSS
jgi:hypothetical protein